MRFRTLALAVVAMGAATGAALLARDWLTVQQAALEAQLEAARNVEAPEAIGMGRVLVAKLNLPAGTFVTEKSMAWVDWPVDGVQESYFSDETAGFEALNGAVIRVGLTAGEPLTTGRVVRPGESGFLAAVLRPAMRAVSVPINATTGISGFVFPGDSVDLLLTQSLKNAGGVRRASEAVLRNVRVIAVDQKTDDQTNTPEIAKTVTLEVTPKQAEIVAVAMEIGRLSLALRSLPKSQEESGEEDPDLTELIAEGNKPSLTWDSQASQAIGGTPTVKSETAPPPTIRVNVVRGGETQTLAFKEGS